MATQKIKVHPGEAATVRAMMTEREQLTTMINGAVQMVCARNGITSAGFTGVTVDDELVLETAGASNLDRTDSPQTDESVAGVISAAGTGESAGNGQRSGKNETLAPVVEAPDAGLPSRGSFRHEGA